LRAHTLLRDATHGNELQGRTREEVSRKHAGIVEKYSDIADRAKYVFKPATEDLEELMDAAVSGEAGRFNVKLASLVKKKDAEPDVKALTDLQIKVLSSVFWWRDVLWEELVTFAMGNRFSLATFDLPEPRKPELPKPKGRTAAVMDTGEVARVFLTGGMDLRADELSAFLEWDGKEFPAKAVKVSDSGRDVTVEFPSLIKFIDKDKVPVIVHLDSPVGAERKEASVGYPCVFFRISETKAPGFAMEITSPKLDVIDTKGKILVTIAFPEDRTKGAESATVRLRGATLDSYEALEGAAEEKAGKLVVKANARLRLTVSNVDDIILVEAANPKDVNIPPIPLQARRIEKEKPKEEKK
jgi:hypothetical protein